MTSTPILHPPAVGESTAEGAWPSQGKWTYEDYRRLPDDGWIYEVEVLQGFEVKVEEICPT